MQRYLCAVLVDELQLAIVPMLVGRGERLFDNLAGGPNGYGVCGAGLFRCRRPRPLYPERG